LANALSGEINMKNREINNLENRALANDRTMVIAKWVQQALFTRQADSYFNPLIQAFAPSEGLSPQYRRARIVHIQHPNKDVVTLRVQPPKNWEGFVPGQYVTCEFEINGVRRKRNYSISSSKQMFKKTGEIEICVHRVPGGLVSNYLIDELRLNSLFTLGEAMGGFGLELESELTQTPTNKKSILLLAAGSGITPFKSMLSSGQQQTLNTQLIYSTKKQDQHLFQAEFLALEKFQKNFNVQLHTTQQNKTDKRINGQTLLKYCKNISEYEVFICGSNEFTREMVSILTGLGLSDAQIHSESFDSAIKLKSIDNKGEVTFTSRNNSALIKSAVVNIDSNLLEQAEQLGFNPKSGCRMGVCHSCTCTKKKGLVRNMLTGEISSADEEEIRICISQPVSQVEIEL